MPYEVVRRFEAALCEYTGAPYAVTVNSCTSALLLAVLWHLRGRERMLDRHTFDARWPVVEIPKRTYVSVPMSIIHAGGWPAFRDENWSGCYQLKPLPVWDSARRFTSGMCGPKAVCPPWSLKVGTPLRMVCVSFHASKILGDTQGGAILHNDPEADAWLRRMRFDGRTEGVAPKEDDFREVGYHAYLSPDVAARLMLKLSALPQHNADLPNSDYPDLSKLAVFNSQTATHTPDARTGVGVYA